MSFRNDQPTTRRLNRSITTARCSQPSSVSLPTGGEKKLLSLVRGLEEAKPLTLLDEPTEGVQWENILHMQRFIEERKADGAAFIVVEQNLAFAERIADRYVVMDQGRIVLTGPRAQIDRAQLLEHLQV